MNTVNNRNLITQEEMMAFVGKNASYYIEKWNNHSNTLLKGFNTSALFCSIEWMIYRKMYWETILMYISYIVISFSVMLFLGLPGRLLSLCFRIFLGVIGNLLYYKKALRVFRKLDVQNELQRLAELSRRGNVSPAAVVVFILLETVYYILLHI